MNREHVNLLMRSVQLWNEWRDTNSAVRPDLSEADLSEADLSGADLCLANLSKANLSFADLGEADLSGADLSGAYLHAARLSGANLRGADLRADLSLANLIGADLSGADLRHADLDEADLSGADLHAAIFSWTLLTDIDLSVANGLETAKHDGPSRIDISAIYRSRGNIPEVFLRGTGVPDNFISYIGSLVGKPFEFYSCFISYSSKDQEFADRLYADLQAEGVRCWFAPHHIAGGKKIHEQIDQAIRVYDRLLLILSEASMSSNWVKTEIANARAREEREGRQMLFPVTLVPFEQVRAWRCFDADTGIDSAGEVREYFIPDFSRWKDHDAYNQAFDRLLRDLKKEAEPTAGASK